MLDTRESFPPAAVPDTGPSRDVTELLLGVLRSIEPYEACILEAERDGDLEVAAFLRELRRQDLDRAREATRLLRRSLRTGFRQQDHSGHRLGDQQATFTTLMVQEAVSREAWPPANGGYRRQASGFQ